MQLAKTLCLVALLGAAYLLSAGMPNGVTGAFSTAFARPQNSNVGRRPHHILTRAAAVMEGGSLDKVGKNVMPQWSGKETSSYNKMIQKNMAEREANLVKAEELRMAFKQRNPDNGPLPGFLPFGEKMLGGRDERPGNFQ